MSQITHASGTGTTSLVIAPTLAMLNGFIIAGGLTQVEMHDCAEVADIAASNLVYKLEAAFGQPIQQTFEGVMFMKGLTIVFTAASNTETFTANIEWE